MRITGQLRLRTILICKFVCIHKLFKKTKFLFIDIYWVPFLFTIRFISCKIYNWKLNYQFLGFSDNRLWQQLNNSGLFPVKSTQTEQKREEKKNLFNDFPLFFVDIFKSIIQNSFILLIFTFLLLLLFCCVHFFFSTSLCHFRKREFNVQN